MLLAKGAITANGEIGAVRTSVIYALVIWKRVETGSSIELPVVVASHVIAVVRHSHAGPAEVGNGRCAESARHAAVVTGSIAAVRRDESVGLIGRIERVEIHEEPVLARGGAFIENAGDEFATRIRVVIAVVRKAAVGHAIQPGDHGQVDATVKVECRHLSARRHEALAGS